MNVSAAVRFWAKMGLGFLGIVAVVIVLLAIFNTNTTTTDVRDTQLTGTPLGRSIAQSTEDTSATLALLQDCLDPKGECGSRSAANQKAALDAIRRDMIITATCIDKPGHQTEAQIMRCVERHRSRNDESPSPSK